MASRAKLLPKPLRIAHNHVRLLSAVAAGIVLMLCLPGGWRLSTRVLVSWDFFAFVYLALAFAVIPQFDLKRVRAKAEDQDEGALLLLILTVVAAIVSLAAIVVELGATKAAHGNEALSFLLAVATLALSWTLIHLMFAFHYAHVFYGGPGDHGSGLTFPDDDTPTYWDFLYFSFVIGMTFQVSDVQVTSKRIRMIVVAHGILSFVFDVTIIALTVNIGANLI